MDAKVYLKSYGWQEGEALQKGGLKKPILVAHKKDTRGLGHGVNKDGETWWENLFDGHLKNLEVTKSNNTISFSIDEQKLDSDLRKNTSPLYRMFVKGEGLAGTVGQTDFSVKSEIKIDVQELFEKQVASSLSVARSAEKDRGSKKDKSRNKESKKKAKASKDKSESKSSDKPSKEKNKKVKDKKKTKKDKEEVIADSTTSGSKDASEKKEKPKKRKSSKLAEANNDITDQKKSKRKASSSEQKSKKRKVT